MSFLSVRSSQQKNPQLTEDRKAFLQPLKLWVMEQFAGYLNGPAHRRLID